MGDPPHVESLDAQPEVFGVEVTSSFNVRDPEVRHNAGYLHLFLLSQTECWAPHLRKVNPRDGDPHPLICRSVPTNSRPAACVTRVLGDQDYSIAPQGSVRRPLSVRDRWLPSFTLESRMHLHVPILRT